MDTDNLNPVIDDIVDSSTTEVEEESDDIENLSDEPGEEEPGDSEGDVEEDQEEDTEESAHEEPAPEKTNTQKRIDKLTAEKKESDRILKERTDQLQVFLSDAHRPLHRPLREHYSSDDAYEGALLNYKMSLANKEDAGRKAIDFVKQTLSNRIGHLDKNVLSNIKEMPGEFYELLAMSSNPESIVNAMKDSATRQKMLNLPAHLLGSAIFALDKPAQDSKQAVKQPVANKPKKNFKQINESSTGKPSIGSKSTKVQSAAEYLASIGYKK